MVGTHVPRRDAESTDIRLTLDDKPLPLDVRLVVFGTFRYVSWHPLWTGTLITDVHALGASVRVPRWHRTLEGSSLKRPKPGVVKRVCRVTSSSRGEYSRPQ